MSIAGQERASKMNSKVSPLSRASLWRNLTSYLPCNFLTRLEAGNVQNITSAASEDLPYRLNYSIRPGLNRKKYCCLLLCSLRRNKYGISRIPRQSPMTIAPFVPISSRLLPIEFHALERSISFVDSWTLARTFAHACMREWRDTWNPGVSECATSWPWSGSSATLNRNRERKWCLAVRALSPFHASVAADAVSLQSQ